MWKVRVSSDVEEPTVAGVGVPKSFSIVLASLALGRVPPLEEGDARSLFNSEKKLWSADIPFVGDTSRPIPSPPRSTVKSTFV